MFLWRLITTIGWGLALVSVILLGWGQSFSAHAQDEFRSKVQQWLLQELGNPDLILVEYTYEGTRWPDYSLGCPVAGETYMPGTIYGYRWTFLYDNGVRYEVHTGQNGTPAALCGSVNMTSEVRLTTYTASEFTLLVPETWLVFPDQTQNAVLFAPQTGDLCDEPGMRVVVLGTVANEITPDQLLNEHILATGISDNPAERNQAGTFGRSAYYQTPCEAGMRQWFISAVVQAGQAYRIEQWAALDQFEQWRALFEQMLSMFDPHPTASLAGNEDAVVVAAPNLNTLRMAHIFVGDVFLGTLDELPGRSVTVVPTFERRYLTFSPDGSFLSFINVDVAQLRVLNAVTGLSPRKIAGDVDPTFPPAWSPDSQQIAYVVNTGTTNAQDDAILEIHVVSAQGGTARQLGSFSFGGACPAEVSDPANVPYFKEAGPLGQDQILVWLPNDRFLFSTRCDSGLGMLNLADNQITVMGDDLRGGVLAPNRTRFLSRTESGLAVLDFVTWQRTNIPARANVRQLAWGPDGQTVYYSTETLAESITLDDPAHQVQGEAIFDMWPVTMNVYDLELIRLNLNTMLEAVIWHGRGRGIGQITPAPDGSGVLFSRVLSGALIADVFRAGGDTLALHETMPAPVLYWLPAGATNAYLLAYAGQPAFAPVTVQEP